MPQPFRSPDVQPPSAVRPILPPRIDARTHLEVAQAYLELGLPEEAMFELSLVEGDQDALREASLLAERIVAQRAPSRRAVAARAPTSPRQQPTRVEGLRPKSALVPTRSSAGASGLQGTVDDAIDRVFDECFAGFGGPDNV